MLNVNRLQDVLQSEQQLQHHIFTAPSLIYYYDIHFLENK